MPQHALRPILSSRRIWCRDGSAKRLCRHREPQAKKRGPRGTSSSNNDWEPALRAAHRRRKRSRHQDRKRSARPMPQPFPYPLRPFGHGRGDDDRAVPSWSTSFRDLPDLALNRLGHDWRQIWYSSRRGIPFTISLRTSNRDDRMVETKPS